MADPEVRQLAGSRRQITLLVVAAVFMVLAGVGFVRIQFSGGQDRAWLSQSRQFATDADTLARAGRNSPPDFTTLAHTMDHMDAGLRALREGDSAAGIPALPGSLQPQLDAVAKSWAGMRQSVHDIVSQEKAYTLVAGNSSALNAAIDATAADYEQIAGHLGSRGDAASQMFLAASQRVRLEQLKQMLIRILSPGKDAQASAEAMAQLAAEFNDHHHRLMEVGASDPAVDAASRKASADFAPVLAAAGAIGQQAAAIGKLQSAAGGLAGNANDLDAAADALEQGLSDAAGKTNVVWPYAVALLAAASALCLIGVAVLYYFGLGSRMREAEGKDAQQQQAILNLLDEITNLANGDLTVDVTVTEDFTGAIADSINYTVQTLRGLVGTINQTSAQIVNSAANTQDTAQRLSEASDRQQREISEAASSIAATSKQMQDVAGRAERIAVQAQTSVQIAHNGAGTVGRTIQNMAALREQIQDTAKRIKRLGESSQEIGNIIEFINDIAEQTNTLALNASIQAAMAGEAGRGFAVVADEVQRLAERAGSATRQIETLVKTIQADTNEAIISMERSTTNVVAGAKSAEEAGQALTRIESSSQELARSIQEISQAARGQSAEATKIAGTMQGIREISVQTAESAGITSEAVGELNALSDKLRESVAGFKLPEGF